MKIAYGMVLLLGITTISGQNLEERSRLFDAIDRFDTESVKNILVSGESVSVTDAAGKTPLHYAVFDDEVTALLLSYGASSNAVDSRGSTPLHLAVQARNCTVVDQLLRSGANVNARNHSGYTPIHYAALCDCALIARMLLKAGANPNESVINGVSVLDIAVASGHTTVVGVLESHGAKLGTNRSLSLAAPLLGMEARSSMSLLPVKTGTKCRQVPEDEDPDGLD